MSFRLIEISQALTGRLLRIGCRPPPGPSLAGTGGGVAAEPLRLRAASFNGEQHQKTGTFKGLKRKKKVIFGRFAGATDKQGDGIYFNPPTCTRYTFTGNKTPQR